MLSYYDTLSLVEQFNFDSGLREFCTNQCKGQCCGECHESNPDTCSKQEGRRLACSIMFCVKIQSLFLEKDRDRLIDLRELVYKRIDGANGCRNKWKQKPSRYLPEKFNLSNEEQLDVEKIFYEFDYDGFQQRLKRHFVNGKWLQVWFKRGAMLVYYHSDPEQFGKENIEFIQKSDWPSEVCRIIEQGEVEEYPFDQLPRP